MKIGHQKNLLSWIHVYGETTSEDHFRSLLSFPSRTVWFPWICPVLPGLPKPALDKPESCWDIITEKPQSGCNGGHIRLALTLDIAMYYLHLEPAMSRGTSPSWCPTRTTLQGAAPSGVRWRVNCGTLIALAPRLKWLQKSRIFSVDFHTNHNPKANQSIAFNQSSSKTFSANKLKCSTWGLIHPSDMPHILPLTTVPPHRLE